MIKVSVIMPVYNGEKYLKPTIEKILSQSLKEFELILIDDGSKDKSGQICDEYLDRDNRIKVIHQENKGICGARNTGLKIAVGEYIAFADQDDDCLAGWLLDNYLLAKEFNADLVKFGRTSETVDESGRVLKRNVRELERKLYDFGDIREHFFELRDKGVFSPVWDGLFRRSIIENEHIQFNEKFRQGEEDTAFCLEFLPHIERLATNTGVYFKHYERYATSTSSGFNVEGLNGHVRCAVIEERIKKELGFNHWTSDAVLSSVHQHLLPILLQLYHRKCDWNFQRKSNYIKELYNYPAFQYNTCSKVRSDMWRKDKKKAIIVRAFEGKHVLTILWGTKLYKHVLNKKYSATVDKD